jgi:hypothetical protein
MGLPFLFSQSSSLTGTRYLAAGQAVKLYVDSARSLGLAAAVYVHERHLAESATPENWTAWIPTLPDYPVANPKDRRLVAAIANYAAVDRNTVSLAPGVLPQAWNQGSQSRSLVAVDLADEQGKLDANSLGPQGWKMLFAKVGIEDWDDSKVAAADRLAANYVHYDNSGNPVPHNDPSDAGQLADGLAAARGKKAFGRLDDLLSVIASTNGYGSGGVGGPHPVVRDPLSRGELAKLAPYLTVQTLGQARGGVADLGNLIEWVGAPYDMLMPDVPQGEAIVGLDSWIESPTRRAGFLSVGGGASMNVYQIQRGGAGPLTTGSGDGLWLRIPPTLNVNTAAAKLRDTDMHPAGVGAIPAPPAGEPDTAPRYAFNSIGELMSAVADKRIGPLWPSGSHLQEWPAWTVASLGVVGVEARATIFDAAGNPLADARRQAVVQSVPQEGFVERRWLTQGQFDDLNRSRAASRMMSWPIATNRDLAQSPDDPADPVDAKPDTGLATKVLRDVSWQQPQVATHLPINWRLTLGGDQAVTGVDVLQSAPSSRIDTLTAAPVLSDDLKPDGLVVESATQLGYSTEANGPLNVVDVTSSELASQHLSLWFQPQEDWSTALGDPVCIAEARSAPSNTGAMHRVSSPAQPGDPQSQNYFGIWYDPQQEALIFVYAPPTIEWTVANSGELASPDNPWTPDIDERCLTPYTAEILRAAFPTGGSFPQPSAISVNRLLNPPQPTRTTSAAWPLFSANRIVHVYKCPPILRKWQWYHLQLCIGTGRPGGMAMLLDGLAGRDVTRVSGSSAIFQPGDQATLPALILEDPLTAVDIPSAPAGVANAELKKMYPDKITVSVPAIAAGLTVFDMLPAPGVIQVGHEYIGYEEISGGLTGGPADLRQCARGLRQGTRTDATLAIEQWPGTRAHAVGDMVLPGDVRLRLNGGRLYGGGCDLADPLLNGDPTNFQVWAMLKKAVGGGNNAVGDNLPVELDPGAGGIAFAQWPNEGIVRVFDPARSDIIYYYFKKNGTNNQFTFSNIADPTSGNVVGDWRAVGSPPARSLAFSYGGNDQPIIWLVSMHLAGPDPTLAVNGQPPYPYPLGLGTQPSAKPCYVQLTRATGDIEWVAYQTILYHTTKGGGYLVNSGGWGLYRNQGQAAADTTLRIARGRQRTAFEAGNYAGVGPQMDVYPNGIDLNDEGVALVHTGTARPALAAPRTFPIGTKVIPVQTEFEHAGTRLLPGDVVTIQPLAGGAPLQRTVRFVSTDGYGSPTLTAAQRKAYDVRMAILPLMTISSTPNVRF